MGCASSSDMIEHNSAVVADAPMATAATWRNPLRPPAGASATAGPGAVSQREVVMSRGDNLPSDSSPDVSSNVGSSANLADGVRFLPLVPSTPASAANSQRTADGAPPQHPGSSQRTNSQSLGAPSIASRAMQQSRSGNDRSSISLRSTQRTSSLGAGDSSVSPAAAGLMSIPGGEAFWSPVLELPPRRLPSQSQPSLDKSVTAAAEDLPPPRVAPPADANADSASTSSPAGPAGTGAHHHCDGDTAHRVPHARMDFLHPDLLDASTLPPLTAPGTPGNADAIRLFNSNPAASNPDRISRTRQNSAPSMDGGGGGGSGRNGSGAPLVPGVIISGTTVPPPPRGGLPPTTTFTTDCDDGAAAAATPLDRVASSSALAPSITTTGGGATESMDASTAPSQDASHHSMQKSASAVMLSDLLRATSGGAHSMRSPQDARLAGSASASGGNGAAGSSSSGGNGTPAASPTGSPLLGHHRRSGRVSAQTSPVLAPLPRPPSKASVQASRPMNEHAMVGFGDTEIHDLLEQVASHERLESDT